MLSQVAMQGKLVMAILMASLSFSLSAQAVNAQGFSPSDGLGSGFGLFTTQTLKPGQLAVGTFLNLSQHPLELTIVASDPHYSRVVDRFITTDVIATFGLYKHINLTANMPINFYHDIAPTLIPNRDRGGPDAGDMRISLKFQLLDEEKSAHHWGVAVVPFVIGLTGARSYFLGNDGMAGGLIVVGEKKLGRHRLYANLGVFIKKSETLGQLVVDDAFTYGVGYQHQFSESQALSGIVELQGSTTLHKFFKDESSSPLEARVILQKNFLKAHNMHTYIGAGMGITNGFSAPDFRVYTGLSMTLNLRH